VRVLIFHGYLLRGTGSNVYSASLAAALVRQGHEVHLVCQDRDPLALDWVDAAGDWDGGALELRERRSPPRAVVYRPSISVLPLYVADRYEGLDARPFADLSDAEVEDYVARNVAAVAEVADRVRPDLALANHLVMGPLVLARALVERDVPYAVKIHGSALEYTVAPHPERFLPAAREGLAPARAVLVGSRHTAERLWAVMDDPRLEGITRLGPPGVDVERFVPRAPAAAQDAAAGLRDRLAEIGAPPVAGGGAATGPGGPLDALSLAPAGLGASSFDRSAAEAAAGLASVDLATDRLVVFVGKLIASKGVELILAAWPLVLARVPDARLLLIGFGAFRPGLEGLVDALARGDLAGARALRAEDGRDLPELWAFLDGLGESDARAYTTAAAALPTRVAFTGRLEHDELAEVLPLAEAMTVTSTFPEAFGMVAAEAAACGVLPIVAAHSGLAEVARPLAAAVPPEVAPWLTFAVGPGSVRELAGHVVAWLEAPAEVREAARTAMVEVARERYSWAGVARTMLAAATGSLEDLPLP
jgi:glycosyltransferase involved in cell wall biosynthesis